MFVLLVSFLLPHQSLLRSHVRWRRLFLATAAIIAAVGQRASRLHRHRHTQLYRNYIHRALALRTRKLKLHHLMNKSVSEWDWIGLSSVLRPRQHSIGYMVDSFYRSKRSNQQYQSTEGTNSTQTNQTYNKQTWTQNTASPLVYNNMGWLGDSSHRGQGCQPWTVVGLLPRYPRWVSEYIQTGTSAQLGYTVPFTLVHTGKYWTEDKLKIQTIHKLSTTQKKSHNTKYSGSLYLSVTPKFYTKV